MSEDNPLRRCLFDQVQFVLAGQTAADGANVAADSLVCAIAVLSDTLMDADRLIDELVPDLKERLRLYWPDVALAKARGLTLKPVRHG